VRALVAAGLEGADDTFRSFSCVRSRLARVAVAASLRRATIRLLGTTWFCADDSGTCTDQ
jgi:hypothetical protein